MQLHKLHTGQKHNNGPVKRYETITQALIERVEHLESQIARLEMAFQAFAGDEPEKRKPGRPKGS